MLDDPAPKDTPLKDALFDTFCSLQLDESIPRFIKKALGILRREANMVRENKGEEQLNEEE